MISKCSPSYLCFLAALSVASASCSNGGGTSEQPTANQELTVLLAAESSGAWPTGLDPATSTTSTINLSLMNAVFGGLFQLVPDPDSGAAKIAGVLAKDYELRDGGRTLVIHLREGAVFSDGTPLDANALRFNIERALRSPCVCAPTGWPWLEENPVTVLDEYTVALNFHQPYPAAVNAFPTTNINWPVSPTALGVLGEERFKIEPVGAGPFQVVSNQLSSKLVLERNPRYWQEGRPYFEVLIFQSIGSEQAAYLALLAGDADVYEGMTSPRLIEQAERNPRITVTRQPPTAPMVIQLNTFVPPFDDQRAREAIYYATDVDAILKALFNDEYPKSQMFTGPGGLFHRQEIPGYREYDLERAKAIVDELGGLSITLGTIRAAILERLITALQTQWQQAGMDVEIELYELADLIRQYQSGEWHAMLQTAGSYDPESITGVSSRFRSDRPFTGVVDETLDRMLASAAATLDGKERAKLYFEIGKHISDKAYAPFLFAVSPAQLAVKGVEGPGLTVPIPPILVNTAILWQDVKIGAE